MMLLRCIYIYKVDKKYYVNYVTYKTNTLYNTDLYYYFHDI